MSADCVHSSGSNMFKNSIQLLEQDTLRFIYVDSP